MVVAGVVLGLAFTVSSADAAVIYCTLADETRGRTRLQIPAAASYVLRSRGAEVFVSIPTGKSCVDVVSGALVNEGVRPYLISGEEFAEVSFSMSLSQELCSGLARIRPRNDCATPTSYYVNDTSHNIPHPGAGERRAFFDLNSTGAVEAWSGNATRTSRLETIELDTGGTLSLCAINGVAGDAATLKPLFGPSGLLSGLRSGAHAYVCRGGSIVVDPQAASVRQDAAGATDTRSWDRDELANHPGLAAASAIGKHWMTLVSAACPSSGQDFGAILVERVLASLAELNPKRRLPSAPPAGVYATCR